MRKICIALALGGPNMTVQQIVTWLAEKGDTESFYDAAGRGDLVQNTISTVVSKMSAAGILNEGGHAETLAGKPARRYSLNPAFVDASPFEFRRWYNRYKAAARMRSSIEDHWSFFQSVGVVKGNYPGGKAVDAADTLLTNLTTFIKSSRKAA